MEGFNKQERLRDPHEKHTPPQPPLKGEGDHEVVEGSLCKGTVEGSP